MITFIAILGSLVAVVTTMVVIDLKEHNKSIGFRWLCGSLGAFVTLLFWLVCLSWEYQKWNVSYWPLPLCP